MSIQVLSAPVLNVVSGGAGSLDAPIKQLFSYLRESGCLARYISLPAFARFATEFGIHEIIITPHSRLEHLSISETRAVARFGRCLGIFTTRQFVMAFRAFLALQNIGA